MEISICNENQLGKTSQQETVFSPQLPQDWSGPQGAPDHCIRNFILLMIYFLYDQYDKCAREQSGLQPTLVKWGREEARDCCAMCLMKQKSNSARPEAADKVVDPGWQTQNMWLHFPQQGVLFLLCVSIPPFFRSPDLACEKGLGRENLIMVSPFFLS